MPDLRLPDAGVRGVADALEETPAGVCPRGAFRSRTMGSITSRRTPNLFATSSTACDQRSTTLTIEPPREGDAPSAARYISSNTFLTCSRGGDSKSLSFVALADHAVGGPVMFQLSLSRHVESSVDGQLGDVPFRVARPDGSLTGVFCTVQTMVTGLTA